MYFSSCLALCTRKSTFTRYLVKHKCSNDDTRGSNNFSIIRYLSPLYLRRSVYIQQVSTVWSLILLFEIYSIVLPPTCTSEKTSECQGLNFHTALFEMKTYCILCMIYGRIRSNITSVKLKNNPMLPHNLKA